MWLDKGMAESCSLKSWSGLALGGATCPAPTCTACSARPACLEQVQRVGGGSDALAGLQTQVLQIPHLQQGGSNKANIHSCSAQVTFSQCDLRAR